jgi:hypothetical protein
VTAITKVLIDLSPTSNGFYSLGADSVLTTAYKLGISTVLPTASTTYALYGRASSATDYFKILSSGYLSLDVNGTVVTSTVLATKDLEYREYSVTLDGNDFVFRENTTVISTVTNATAAAKTLTLNLIGNSNGANFYLGILADPVMGALEFKLNKFTDNFELPVNNVFGSEKVINGDYSNGTTGWIPSESTLSVVGGELQITGAAGTGAKKASQSITGLVVGDFYELKATARVGTASRVRVLLEDGGLGFPLAISTTSASEVTGRVYFTAVATTTLLQLDLTNSNDGDTGFFDNITIKSITNVINYNNIGTGASVRNEYLLSNGNTQWISNLRTIDIGAP